jgi:hypothetical protein
MPNGMVHMMPDGKMPMMPNGKKKAASGMTHAEKVAKCMKANPGMSLGAASKMVASMKK